MLIDMESGDPNSTARTYLGTALKNLQLPLLGIWLPDRGTVGIFLLQGFHFKGFNLGEGLLKLLGGTTNGEVAGLITLTIKAPLKSIFAESHDVRYRSAELPRGGSEGTGAHGLRVPSNRAR
jgi:hypothetical protein